MNKIELNEVTFVIPARLGSSRLAEKVMLPFPIDGKNNLIEYKVNQLREVILNPKIILSCGESRLYELAKKLKIDISVRDMRHIVGHEVGTRESILEVIKDIKTEHVAWTTVVTPLHNGIIIKRAIEEYFNKIKEGYDSLTTGIKIQEYLWLNNKAFNYSADENHPDSQNLPELFRLTNGIYIAPKKIMLECGYFLGKKPYIMKVPKTTGIDIDELEDYLMACQLEVINNRIIESTW